MVPMDLTRGGKAELTALDGERIWLTSDIASAPGSRLEGAVEGGRRVRVKVHRCVRQGERFDIEGRCIDLTRLMRQWLAERLPTSPVG